MTWPAIITLSLNLFSSCLWITLAVVCWRRKRGEPAPTCVPSYTDGFVQSHRLVGGPNDGDFVPAFLPAEELRFLYAVETGEALDSYEPGPREARMAIYRRKPEHIGKPGPCDYHYCETVRPSLGEDD